MEKKMEHEMGTGFVVCLADRLCLQQSRRGDVHAAQAEAQNFSPGTDPV